jgi:glycosyltransferase involved in cell wall biosynthesis
LINIRELRISLSNKKIRVLYTIPNFDTAGSGKALLNIAKGLDRGRFEPLIMCRHNKGPFFDVVKSTGIPVHLFKYTTDMKPYHKGLVNCWKISREFKRIAPDIIHSFHYSADYSEALAARMAGIKWVYTKKNMNWGGGSANAWKLRTLLANGIAAQNTDMMRDFFPGNSKVRLIPRGVNMEEFAYDPSLPDLRSRYRISPNQKLIITVANLVPVKGIEVLLEAFRDLAPHHPDWSLMIVGDDQNEYGAYLKELCVTWRIQDKVIFTGKVTDVKSHLQMAEIFVLPTLNQGRKEGSPVSLLEAMANGRCVLGSAVPGIKDQLKEFPELLFEAGSVSDLTKKLHSVMQLESETLSKLIASIIQFIKLNYTIEIEVARHAELYEALH